MLCYLLAKSLKKLGLKNMISQNDFIKKVQKRAMQRQKLLSILFKITGDLFYTKEIKINYQKPKGNFVFLTICNRKSFPMVKYSILSFLKNSNLHPREIVIISDGTWEKNDEKNFFSFLKIPILIEDWTKSAFYHRDKGRETLYQYACKQIWGKKFAAILRYSEQQLTLFSDPDVLWYGSPINETMHLENTYLKLSIDNSHNYDTELIKTMSADYLYDKNPINCGIVLIKGDMFSFSKTIEIALNKESENPGNFSEQTIFALLSSEFGELVWTKNEINAEIDDILSPVLKKSNYSNALIARHYLWSLKWLYWRDVLTLL